MVAVAGLPENASKTIRELKRQGFEGRMIGSQIFADPNILDLFGDLAEAQHSWLAFMLMPHLLPEPLMKSSFLGDERGINNWVRTIPMRNL